MTWAHHPMGPSRLRLRELCPGSYMAELPYWESGESEEDDDELTRRGSKRHAIAARGLYDPAQRAILIAELPDAEDRDVVSSWWETIDGFRGEYGCSPFFQETVEERIQLYGSRCGTPDYLMSCVPSAGELRMVVLDMKGYPPCGALWSLQLFDLAWGAMLAMQEELISGRSIRLTVGHISMSGCDIKDVPPSHFRAQRDRITRVLSMAVDKGANRIVGSHCTHCKAKDQCYARTQIASQATQLMDPVGYMLRLSPEDRCNYFDAMRFAIKLLTEAEEKIKSCIKDGSLDIAHYTISPVRRRALSADAVSRLEHIAVTRNIPLDQVLQPRSVKDLERVLGEETVYGMVEYSSGTNQVRRLRE